MSINIIKLTADWCSACKRADDLIKPMIKDNPAITYHPLDIDKSEEGKQYMEAFGLRSIPSFVINVTDDETGVEREIRILNLESTISFLKDKLYA